MMEITIRNLIREAPINTWQQFMKKVHAEECSGTEESQIFV